MPSKPRKQKGNLQFAAYLRCSTDDQGQGDFTTIDTQRELNRAHIAALGGILVKEYSDEGRSGTNLNRPAWKQMLADAEAGTFDSICVTYMSRLGRGDAFTIAQYELGKHGVQVELVKEKFTDDLAGYMGKTMTTMMDGVYPKMVSQWTKTKMAVMVQKGYHCGGITPFGYRTEMVTDANGFHSAEKEPPKRLVPDEESAGYVVTAYDMAAAGDSAAAIREYLNTITPRKWTTQTVKNLLSLETYTGVQQFGEWRNEQAHKPVVDAELWKAVQELIGVKTERFAKRANDDYRYYLAGRLNCPHCGCPYTQASFNGRSGRVHYYVCRNANRHGTCPVGRINADRLHAAILSTIERAANHWTVMRRMISDSETWSGPSEQQTAVRGQLAKRKQYLEMQMGNLTRAIGEGRALDALLAALEKAEKDLATVEDELATASREIAAATFIRPTTQQVQDVWAKAIALWPKLREDERMAMMQAFIVEIDVTSKERATVNIETIPTEHALWFELSPIMGAGVGLEPTTFGL